MSASCGSCRHARHDLTGTPGIFCHRYPPTAQALVVPVTPDLRNPQGMAVQILRVRPNVGPDESCGEWSIAPGGTSPLTLIK